MRKMEKKMLAALFSVALLLCAVPAGGLATVSAENMNLLPSFVDSVHLNNDGSGSEAEWKDGALVVHVTKPPEVGVDPELPLYYGVNFWAGHSFTKEDNLFCMLDISSDIPFAFTLHDSDNEQWINFGYEFENSFGYTWGEPFYFIPAGRYQVALYLEGVYAARDVEGDSRYISDVYIEGYEPGNITINNFSVVPGSECEKDADGEVIYQCAIPSPGTFPERIYTFGDFEYGIFMGGTVGITGYTGNAEELVIPESIEGKKVKAICNEAFKWCYTLRSVSLPEGVTWIGNNAFEGCTALTKVSIPGSVKSILGYAFSGCTALIEVTLAEGVTSIGGGAFYECSSLLTLHLPESLTEIGGSAFWGCSGLTSLTIPSGVDTIGRMVFFGCDNLSSVTIPDGVTTIATEAFASCNNLASVIVPESVTSIAPDAFTKSSWADTELTIYGVPDSLAERYAKANGFAFAPIGEQNPFLSDVDTDHDGEISTAEAQAFYIGFYDALTNGNPPAGADVSGDGRVDIEDVLTVYLIASGKKVA